MSMMFFLPNILLSGFMFPFAGMPVWAQWIGEALPLTHFIRIVRAIMLKGATLADLHYDAIALFVPDAVRDDDRGDAVPADAGLALSFAAHHSEESRGRARVPGSLANSGLVAKGACSENSGMRHNVHFLFWKLFPGCSMYTPSCSLRGISWVIPLGGAGCGARGPALSPDSGGLGNPLHGYRNDPCARSSLNDSRQETKPGVVRKRGPIGT